MSTPEFIDFETLMEQRRKEAAESLQAISHAELTTLFAGIFVSAEHPWTQTADEFLTAHKGETFVKGDVDQGDAHFIYAPATSRGIWYIAKDHVRGLGRISEKSAAILSGIISEKQKSGELSL
ncbi:MAG: hypothetical protein ABIP97_13250 [Chthoniobacterales bacterium]